MPTQQGYIGRNPGDGRTIINRQTSHVTTGVQTSFTMTAGYDIGFLDVYLNGIKQTETLDYTAADGSTINFSPSFAPMNGDVLEFVSFETLNITNIRSARKNFTVGQDLDVSGKVTIGSSLTVASDLVVNGTFTTINTEILDVEDKTVGIASTSSPSNTTADGAGIVIYGGSDGDKSLTWNSTKSNFVLVGGGVSIGTGVTISTPADNVLAFSVNSAEKARFNNFGAFTVGYEGEAWHQSTYVGVLQAGSGAWIGQTPAAGARAEWVNNAYYDSVNTRWEYIAGDEANRIYLENGEIHLQSAAAGSADGAITWNEKLAMTVGGDFKIGPTSGIGITISSSGNVDAIGIITASSFVGNVTGTITGTASGNAVLTGSTNNTIVTVTGANAITGEANLQFDGTNIGVGVAPSGVASYSTIHLKGQTSGNGGAVRLTDYGDTPDSDDFTIYKNSAAGYLRINGTDPLIAYLNGADRVRIDSSGRVMIGTDTPGHADLDDLTVASSGNTGITIRSGTSNTGILGFADGTSGNSQYMGFVQYGHANNAMSFNTNDAEAMRIDSVGGLLVAHTTSRNNFNSAASTEHAPIIQLEGINQKRAISITSSNNNDGGILMLARQNGNPGTNTVVSSGDQIGRVDFQASGGTNMEVAAQITAEVDGTPGDNDMPGRLLFKTTADGANSTTERLRIDSSGLMGLGTNSPSSFNAYARNFVVAQSSGDAGLTISAEDSASEYGSLHFSGGTTVRSYIDVQNGSSGRMFLMNKMDGYMAFGTNNTERFRVGNSGQIGLSGANYGTSGQVLTSQGSGSAVQWANASSVTTAVNAGPLSGATNYDFTLPTNCYKVEFVGHNISTSGSGTPSFRGATSAGVLSSGNYTFTDSAWRSSQNQIDFADENMNAGSDTGDFIVSFYSSSSSDMWIFEGKAVRRTQGSIIHVLGMFDLGGNALTSLRFFPAGTGFDTGRIRWTGYSY